MSRLSVSEVAYEQPSVPFPYGTALGECCPPRKSLLVINLHFASMQQSIMAARLLYMTRYDSVYRRQQPAHGRYHDLTPLDLEARLNTPICLCPIQ